MRCTIIHILCLLMLTASLRAERVTLRSGKQLTGKILAQTEEIVLFQTAAGQRFQFPSGDILSIETDIEDEIQEETKREETFRPVAFRIAVSGGIAAAIGEQCGGMSTAELQIGARRIAGKDIFLGGSVGYAVFFLSPSAHFIPLQAVVSVPIPLTFTGKRCAELNASFGYALATKGNKSGLTGSLAAGVRFAIAKNSSVFVGGTAQFIQTERDRKTAFGDDLYTHSEGTALWLIGAKTSIQF